MASTTELHEAKTQEHKLTLRKAAQAKVHGTNPIGKFNMFLAVAITKIVGSMWCAYAFAILSLISLPSAIQSHNPLIIVGWIAQTFLQLVLLPIIIVGQNVQAEASDARARHDHETLTAIHTLTAEIYKLDEKQTEILNQLASQEER